MTTKVNILSLITIFICTTMYGQSLPFACTGSIETYAVHGYEGSVFNWQVKGGHIIRDFNDSIYVQWDEEPGIRDVQVIEITEFNCMGNPVDGEVEVRSPQVDLGGYIEICQGEIHTFNAGVSYPVNVEYFWNNSNIAEEPIYSSDTSEVVSIKAVGADGCEKSDTAVLVMNPLPVFTLGGDTILCGNQTVELMVKPVPPETHPVEYSFIDWSTGSTFDYIEVESGLKTIWAEITDEKGCKYRDSLFVDNCEMEKLFAEMPNTITPNGDGNNDVWQVPYIGQFPTAVLEIFDRWGRLVYRSQDLIGDPFGGIGSDGTELPMGAYYYVLDLNYEGFEPFSGTVNILK